MAAIALNTAGIVDPAVRRFAVNVGSIIDRPLYHATVSADAENTVGTNVRRLTLQVRNRRGDILRDRFLVHLWLAATASGAPQAAQTVSFAGGTPLETVLPNGEWRAATDAAGRIILDVEVSGSARRYLRSFVLSRMDTAALGPSKPLLLSILHYQQAAGIDFRDLPIRSEGIHTFSSAELGSLAVFQAAVAVKYPGATDEGVATLDCEVAPTDLPWPPDTTQYASGTWPTRLNLIASYLDWARSNRPNVRWGVYQQPYYPYSSGVAPDSDLVSAALRADYLAAYTTGSHPLTELLAHADYLNPEFYQWVRFETAARLNLYAARNAQLCVTVNGLVVPQADRQTIPIMWCNDLGTADFITAAELGRIFSALAQAGAPAVIIAGRSDIHSPATWQAFADSELTQGLRIAGYI